MTTIPQNQNTTAALIDASHERRNQSPPNRYHMGISGLGDYCERRMWLSFRWVFNQNFSGRVLRLFRRGQDEEATFVKDLRAIGVDIRETGTNGKQFWVSFGSHVSGSMDGIIEKGLPEAPQKRHVVEFKTHNKKSFDQLTKEGVEKSKPMHYVQMQCYMHGIATDRALYMAVCKDDDRLYVERVKYKKDVAAKAIERGQRIALSDRMPPPISTDATWYQCKMCDYYDFCHNEKLPDNANCRTCAHSTPQKDSTFTCEKWAATVPNDAQHKGCPAHVIHPDLVPWPIKDGPDQWTAVYEINGATVQNGEAGYSSKELLANPTACASGDANISALRENFDAEIVG